MVTLMERRGVFISYAREDGERFAHGLSKDLEKTGIDVWMDRLDMQGGRDWWQQILEAINRAGFLVLVMTPGAAASPTTAREWQHARQQGVCVFPVVASPDFDFTTLPKWMAARHFYRLPDEWDTFLNYLNSPCLADRAPFMAPALPRRYVVRSRELELVKSLLLDIERRDPLAITTSVQGSGGYGKTTLAVALCHDDDVLTAFDAGVFWVTLGREQGRVSRELAKLYRALTGEPSHAVDMEEAARDVAMLLRDKRALIVLDDVWHRQDLGWFLRGGEQCARLVTTRLYDVAREASPHRQARVRIDEMTGAEAVDLLIAGLDPAPTDLSGFVALTRRLREWPLLVNLARGAIMTRMDRGASAERALGFVNEALDRHGFVAFDANDSGQRNDAAWASVGASLDFLDDDEIARWADLAVFPEDIAIPLRTLGQLWGLDEFITEELAIRLDSLSLIRLDLAAETIQVHDVLLMVAERYAGDIVASHQRLVAAWGELHSLDASDGYAWQWVGHHLEGADQASSLRELLFDYQWIRNKLRLTDSHSLNEDYERFQGDNEMRLAASAIRLSGRAINRDPHQLNSQLLGRLSSDMGSGIAQLLNAADEPTTHTWLRPRANSLRSSEERERSAETGHADEVYGVAVTPDGTHIVTGSADHTAKIWDPETGKELHTLTGHSDTVNGVAVTPDGTHIVTASADHTAKIWDRETGKELHTLTGHSDMVNGVAVTPDGTHIVTASADHTAKIWDRETGKELHTLTGHADAVNKVAVAPDGIRIITTSADHTAKIWDRETGKELHTLIGHANWVYGVAVTPDSTRIITTAADDTIMLWSLETGTHLRTLNGHMDFVYGAAVTPDSARLITSSGDYSVKVWDLETGKELRTLNGHSDEVYELALTPDGNRIVTASGDYTMRLWDLTTGDHIRTFSGSSNWMYGMAVTPDGDRVISTSSDATVTVWDLETGEALRTLTGHTQRVNAVTTTPDGTCAVTASADHTVRLWHVDTGNELRTFTGHTNWVYGVAVTPDGTRIVSASYDNTLKVWDLETGAEFRTLTGHTKRVNQVAVTPDGTRIVSASGDNTLKIWDLETGAELRTLAGHTSRVYGVAITPDGTWIVSTSGDNTVKVWDLETGAELRTLKGHTNWVNGVAITPDGRYVTTTSGDHTAKVWDLQTGTLAATFTANGSVNACAAPGKHLFCIGASGRVHVLDLVIPGQRKERSRAHIGRS